MYFLSVHLHLVCIFPGRQYYQSMYTIIKAVTHICVTTFLFIYSLPVSLLFACTLTACLSAYSELVCILTACLSIKTNPYLYSQLVSIYIHKLSVYEQLVFSLTTLYFIFTAFCIFTACLCTLPTSLPRPRQDLESQ